MSDDYKIISQDAKIRMWSATNFRSLSEVLAKNSWFKYVNM